MQNDIHYLPLIVISGYQMSPRLYRSRRIGDNGGPGPSGHLER
jgi:hypothetical protein